jgi:imidazolonepropionase
MTPDMRDIKIINGKVLTFKGRKPLRGTDMGSIEVLKGVPVCIEDGRIVSIDKDEKAREVIDAHGKIVMPGFIDPHTHLIFAGSREREFGLRLSGKSYMEIRESDGGILSTVRATREASSEELIFLARKRLDYALSWGTTTIEVKSGYGLSLKDESKILKVIKRLSETHPITIVPTFLGAHDFPPEIRREEYIELIISELIPKVSREGLARFCDVFCEEGVYTEEESERILNEGKKFGLAPKIHADELKSSGGCEVGIRVGATSCDHLIYISEREIELMTKSDTIAVLLPGTSFFLSLKDKPPVRKMIQMEIPVAIGSDFNPGSSPILSMPIIIGLACLTYGMTPQKAIVAATINAAYATGEKERGSIEEGKWADIIILNVDDYRKIPYWFGYNPVEVVIKEGKRLDRKG